MSIEYKNHIYECGTNCTADGCPGHESDVPVGFKYKGVWFEVDGYSEGEVPWDGPDGVKDREAYKALFFEMLDRLEDESPEIPWL